MKLFEIIDYKVSVLLASFFTVSFTNLEIGMKIIAFLLTVGYTLHRWYYLIKNKKE